MNKDCILSYRGIEFYPIPLRDPECSFVYLVACPFSWSKSRISVVAHANVDLETAMKPVAKTENKCIYEEAKWEFFNLARDLDAKLGITPPDNSLAHYDIVKKYFDTIRPIAEPICHKIIDRYLDGASS